MNTDRFRSGRAASGFTLVELLAATAAAVVVAGVALAVATHVLEQWARTGGSLVAAREAGQALELLERDLRSAVLARDGRVWLAATVQPDQAGAGDIRGTALGCWSASGQPKPGWASPGTAGSSLDLAPASGRLEDCRFGMAGVWLRLIAQVADDSTGPAGLAAPRAVGYQIVRHGAGGDPGATVRYSLFRSEVRTGGADSTFATGYDVFATAYNDPAVGGASLADAGNLRRPRRDQLLAGNVVDFGVRFRGRDAAGVPVLLFPTGNGNLGFAATVRDGTGTCSPVLGADPALPPVVASTHHYVWAEMSYGFPEEAEVFLRVLTEEGARQVEALEAGRLAGPTWWDLVRAHSQVFTRRVVFGGVAP